MSKALQALFVRDILPAVQHCCRKYFRRLRGTTAEELTADAIGIAWERTVSADRLGHDVLHLVGGIARFSVKTVLHGTPFTGSHQQEPLADRCQYLTGCHREAIELHLGETFATGKDDICEVVHFRVEFPRFYHSRNARERLLMDALAVGISSADVARQLGTSRARVAEMRGRLRAGWKEFCEK